MTHGPAADDSLADILFEILARHETTPAGRGLRQRIRELGDNQTDEVAQLRQLQKACRASPALARDLEEAGLGNVSAIDPRRPTPEAGRLIQAFNRMIEERWEDP